MAPLQLRDWPDPAPLARAQTQAWRDGPPSPRARDLPEETPIALTYDRATFAVMMTSPLDLEDFAIGFSLSEGIIAQITDIARLDIVPTEGGIECRMALAPGSGAALRQRRRHIAGPLGCGLCGLDSLREANRPPPHVQSRTRLPARRIAAAMQAMARGQSLNQATHAAHAAALLHPAHEALLLREDVGRHTALDKLVGAAARLNQDAAAGAVLLTSRVSLDLVQKAAAFGAGILAAISVPTARAVREAEAANLTLIGVTRADGFEIFSHPERIVFD